MQQGENKVNFTFILIIYAVHLEKRLDYIGTFPDIIRKTGA